MRVRDDKIYIVVDIQRQLTKTLILQAIIPLFTCCLPVMVMMIVLILPVKLPEFIFPILGLPLTYIPLGNGLSMLLYIKAYRRFTKNFILRKYKFFFTKLNSTVNPSKSTLTTKS